MAHVIKDTCLGCQACVDACPVGAISYDEAKGICVISDECVDCGACEGVDCPADAIVEE